MIQSMTGYGAAEHVEGGVRYALEVRSVNHRYQKLLIKLPEYLQFTESTVEKAVRKRIVRGSASCTLRVQGEDGGDLCPINARVLQAYLEQLKDVRVPDGLEVTVDLSAMVTLPGVIHSPELDDEARRRQTELVAGLAGRAVDALIEMRREEGRALREALLSCTAVIRERLERITERAPVVINEYHERLKSRVATLMEAGGFELQVDGLAREVAVFAERCDISEELTRLASHLDQFVELCDKGEPVGRTMDFLAQELLREANTIASKSNDAAIARDIVETKAIIDRLKEQVQNVE